MRKRRAYISFPPETGNDPALLSMQKVLEGLNIKFSVRIYAQSGQPSEAFVEVYNLNREDLAYLTTTSATLVQKQNLFQLYAGYENDVKMLFSGQVFEATPDGTPDVVLSLRGLSDVKWWGHNLEMQKSQVKVMDLIDYAAEQMGYEVNIDERLRQTNELLNTVKEDYSFTGSPMQLLEQVQSMVGGVTADPQTVFISTYNGQINIWSPSTQQVASKLVINKKSGMIGLPKPTGAGCKVKILLNNGIKTGDVVEIQSDRLSVANGDYYVIGITHEGELRGRNWYSTLDCSRVSNYKAGGYE